jgi:hypothetical protein
MPLLMTIDGSCAHTAAAGSAVYTNVAAQAAAAAALEARPRQKVGDCD